MLVVLGSLFFFFFFFFLVVLGRMGRDETWISEDLEERLLAFVRLSWGLREGEELCACPTSLYSGWSDGLGLSLLLIFFYFVNLFFFFIQNLHSFLLQLLFIYSNN